MSAFFRKKPIAVEARQLLGDVDGRIGRDLAAWCGGYVVGANDDPRVFVPTLEGELRAQVGDWIVRGPHGEFWPVKGAIFAETYEPATEQPEDPTDRLRRIYVDGKGDGWIDLSVDEATGERDLTGITNPWKIAAADEVRDDTGGLREIGRCW